VVYACSVFDHSNTGIAIPNPSNVTDLFICLCLCVLISFAGRGLPRGQFHPKCLEKCLRNSHFHDPELEQTTGHKFMKREKINSGKTGSDNRESKISLTYKNNLIIIDSIYCYQLRS
jgi:hypothetical protein